MNHSFMIHDTQKSKRDEWLKKSTQKIQHTGRWNLRQPKGPLIESVSCAMESDA